MSLKGDFQARGSLVVYGSVLRRESFVLDDSLQALFVFCDVHILEVFLAAFFAILLLVDDHSGGFL